MAVAGERPLGQQVVAAHRPRRLGPARRGAVAPTARRGRRRGRGSRSAATGPTTTGPVAEVVDHRRRPPCRGSPTPPSTTTSRSPCMAHSASMPAARADAAYLVEDVGLACARRVRRPARPRRRRVPTSRARWPGRAPPRRPRRAAPRRRPAPRAGRPRRRAPRRRGRRPRRWRRRPRGRSAAPRRARRRRRRGRGGRRRCSRRPRSSSRTRSTVCWRLITPARARGAAPKTDEASRCRPGRASPVSRYQSTKPRMPACTISPTQDRSSALSSRNHGRSVSIRAVAAVLSAPVDAGAAVGRPLGRTARGAEVTVRG